MVILALNAGSSSLKFGVFRSVSKGGVEPWLQGAFDSLAEAPRFWARNAEGAVLADTPTSPRPSTRARLHELFAFLDPLLAGDTLDAVGHRIVHGGSRFVSPARLTDPAMDALAELTPIAPLHQPASLEPARELSRLRPDLPQFGCFDTAFHSTLVPPVSRYAIPREYEDQGIRRYGFHGLSYEFIAGRLAEISADLPSKRTVVAHLGSGCSLCAMREGRSHDTTMGFTALDGLMMATRSGTIDPGIVLYLQRAHGLSVDEVEQMLYRRSGLLGVSDISGDTRTLLASADPRAAEALDLFTFRISREIAALASTLQGLELLVFTGGVGEHAGAIRDAVCRRLGWLGVRLDEGSDHDLISRPDSAIEVRIIPTNEELTIARQVNQMLTA